MDLSIRRVAKDSTLSGAPLVPGEVVESFLFRNAEGELERADLRREELDGWSVPSSLLCRWRHRVREVDESRQQAERASVQSAEELFLSLAATIAEEDGAGERPREEPLILLNLLALMLERKRVLRAVPEHPDRYWHGREKQLVVVPRTDLSPERILPLVAELDALL